MNLEYLETQGTVVSSDMKTGVEKHFAIKTNLASVRTEVRADGVLIGYIDAYYHDGEVDLDYLDCQTIGHPGRPATHTAKTVQEGAMWLVERYERRLEKAKAKAISSVADRAGATSQSGV